MKNLKKTGKRFFAMFLSLVMALGIMQVTALAGTFDSVTVHFRVFDESTGQVYELDKTDTAYASQTTSWQSAPYQVPNLSTLIPSGASFGRVTKATATNVQTYESFNQGTTIYFSTNANSGTITYWVNWYKSGSGSGTGSNQNENVNIGTGGRYSWTQYIRYHSNYPDGTDYTYTVAYNIQSYSNMYNTFGQVIKTLAGVGFSVPSGYSAKTPVWNTAKNGSGTGYAPNSNYVFYQSQANKTLDLYAQYEAEGGTPATPVTLTYMDGDTVYRTISGFLAGDPVTVIDCTTEKEGYTFKGWDTSANATNIVYAAGSTFQIMGNTTLYAVWEENTPVPTTTTLKIRKDVTGDLTADKLPDNFQAMATIQNLTTNERTSVTLSKTKLQEEVTISKNDAYNVMITESNYDVTNYSCEISGAAGAMVAGNMVIYNVAAGSTEPICFIENKYTSTTPPAPDKDLEVTMKLEKEVGDGNWVEVPVNEDFESEPLNPDEHVRYTITVFNPNSVSVSNQTIVNDLDPLLELQEGTCHAELIVGTTSTPLATVIDPPIDEFGSEIRCLVENFTAGATATITYDAIVRSEEASTLLNVVYINDGVMRARGINYRATAEDVLGTLPSAIVKLVVAVPNSNEPGEQELDIDSTNSDAGLGV